MKPQAYAASPTRRAQLLPSSASSPNTDSQSFYKPEYWGAVGQGIKQEFRSTRLKALQKINNVIYEAILFNEAMPRRYVDEALQLTYQLLDAKAQDPGDMDQWERDFNNFASSTLRELQQRGGGVGGSNNSSSPVRYGGVPGNTIFKMVKADVMVPILTSFLSKFSEQTTGLKYDDQAEAVRAFLHGFLELAGKERGWIAEMTATKNFEEFGRLNEGSKRLVDFVNPGSGWKPWQTMMLEKIGELISPAWEEFRTDHKDDPDPWGFLPVRGELLLKKENVSLRLGRENNGYGPTGYLFDNRQGEGATYFRFNWSPEEDAEKATISPIKVTGLVCVHPSPMWCEAASVLAADVLDVLRWTHDPQQLQDKLASIFYDLSHTSTFQRGGASISEALIEAAARLHGHTVEFSPDWMPPDHPQPDQYALSEFDRDKFIYAARKHIILRKIDQAER